MRPFRLTNNFPLPPRRRLLRRFAPAASQTKLTAISHKSIFTKPIYFKQDRTFYFNLVFNLSPLGNYCDNIIPSLHKLQASSCCLSKTSSWSWNYWLVLNVTQFENFTTFPKTILRQEKIEDLLAPGRDGGCSRFLCQKSSPREISTSVTNFLHTAKKSNGNVPQCARSLVLQDKTGGKLYQVI